MLNTVARPNHLDFADRITDNGVYSLARVLTLGDGRFQVTLEQAIGQAIKADWECDGNGGEASREDDR